MNKDFYSMVMKHFNYLVTDYGFVVKKAEISENRSQTEGRIEFETATTFVTVSGEQFGADACVGRLKDDKYYHCLDPRAIYEYLSLTQADKEIICSFNPSDDRKARVIVHQNRLLHSKRDSSNHVEDIENQIADNSRWLRQYAKPFLRGDFSRWLEIYEFMVTRQRAERARAGKDELVQVVGRGKNHRESVFQSSLDYLERLRKENE